MGVGRGAAGLMAWHHLPARGTEQVLSDLVGTCVMLVGRCGQCWGGGGMAEAIPGSIHERACSVPGGRGGGGGGYKMYVPDGITYAIEAKTYARVQYAKGSRVGRVAHVTCRPE
jgi:hypothetical protein